MCFTVVLCAYTFHAIKRNCIALTSLIAALFLQVCEYYMVRGYFSELIALLESGIGLERAHMGIFTALGEMYANHAPEKLMEHLKLFCTRVNIPRLISICDRCAFAFAQFLGFMLQVQLDRASLRKTSMCQGRPCSTWSSSAHASTSCASSPPATGACSLNNLRIYCAQGQSVSCSKKLWCNRDGLLHARQHLSQQPICFRSLAVNFFQHVLVR